jgi:heme/copper-type cytochrome/quinol oxidase subunit 2
LPSAAPPAAESQDPVRAILLVLFSIILVTIVGIMAAYCYKRLRQRNAEDDDRLEEPLLIPSEEF